MTSNPGGRVPLAGGKGVMSLIKMLFKKKPKKVKKVNEGYKKPDLAKRRREIMGDEEKAAKDFEMRLQEILAKHSTKHATGGIAGMLGE